MKNCARAGVMHCGLQRMHFIKRNAHEQACACKTPVLPEKLSNERGNYNAF